MHMNSTQPILRSGQTSEIDLGVAGSMVVYRCDFETAWSFQVAANGVQSWPASGVCTVYFSNDGINFVGVGSAVTLSAFGITTSVDVSSFGFVALVVTTAGSSSIIPRVTGFGKRITA